MRYLMHLSVEDFHDIVDTIVNNRFQEILSALRTSQDQKKLLKIEEVATIFRVTPRTIRTWVRKRKIRDHWMGGRQYFIHSEINDLLHGK
ncbi:MAG: helix-turn-helix domain-containing protein [Bacteroidetes bacterium]|nr:helix-turn-helix domain-containing protein [Bacteroidota bacterium]